jgi:MFS family permease
LNSAERPGPLSILRHRDFRLYWAGQAISMVGGRMQAAGILWHVYDLTRSEFALGATGLARLAPLAALALLGGALADALDRRRMLIVSQSVLCLVSAALAFYTLSGGAAAWPLYLAIAVAAATGAFDGPARQALLPNLVERNELASAVSLNSLTSQVASILGPGLMGVLVAHTSIGVVYLVNALSFVGVIGALLLMRRPGSEEPPAGKLRLSAVAEGVRFVRETPLLTSLMLLDFWATFWASASVLLPAYVDRILHGTPQVYGTLAAAPSVGALLAAAGLTLGRPIRAQGMVVLAAVFCYGLATVGLGLTAHTPVAFLCLAGTGAADTVSMVLRQTIRQMVTPDALRGRMTSINLLFVRGGPQLGEVEAGVVAGFLGVPFAIVSGGVACMATVFLMARRIGSYRNGDPEAPGVVR